MSDRSCRASITIRPSVLPDDEAPLSSLVGALQDFGRRHDSRMPPGTVIAADYLVALVRQCQDHEGQIYVAEGQGELFGFVVVLARAPAVEPADGVEVEARIIDLYVTDAARGQGIGRALLSGPRPSPGRGAQRGYACRSLHGTPRHGRCTAGLDSASSR